MRRAGRSSGLPVGTDEGVTRQRCLDMPGWESLWPQAIKSALLLIQDLHQG